MSDVSVPALIRYVNPEIVQTLEDGSLFGGIIGSKDTRVSSTLKREVLMHDVRSLEAPGGWSPTLEENGATLVPFVSACQDYRSEEEFQKVLLPEATAAVKKAFNADYVAFWVTNTRSENPEMDMVRSGRNKFTHSYARFAHVDSGPFTETLARTHLREKFFKDDPSQADPERMDVASCVFWKPWDRTVAQNPLAILDAQSLDFERDAVLFHYDNGQRPPPENPITQLRESPTHRWLFWKHQTVDEALIFKQMDLRPGRRARRAFHTSFDDPTAPEDSLPRRSVEIHFFCGFKKEKEPAATAKL